MVSSIPVKHHKRRCHVKQNLTVTVIALVGLLCSAWEGAVAGSGSVETYLLCNFNALDNSVPTVYQLKVGAFRPFFSGLEARMNGFNTTNGALLDGKVIGRSNGTFFMNWSEFPNNTAQQYRTAFLNIPATLNYPWNDGYVLDITAGNTFRGGLSFTAGTCQTATGTP
jgi:hypothetical protein